MIYFHTGKRMGIQQSERQGTHVIDKTIFQAAVPAEPAMITLPLVEIIIDDAEIIDIAHLPRPPGAFVDRRRFRELGAGPAVFSKEICFLHRTQNKHIIIKIDKAL